MSRFTATAQRCCSTWAQAPISCTAGKLGEALEALGVSPDDITHVIFTRPPRPSLSVLDDFDEPLFANATHLMGAAEPNYWLDPDTINTIGAERQTFAAGAFRRLELLKDRIETFEPEAELLPRHSRACKLWPHAGPHGL
ncbi:MAG: hypothetical protein R3D78_06530 [Paracoccaceae bacterium]